jgi:hypothetical protein
MNQEDLLLSLHEEGLTAKQIHQRLVEIFGSLAMPCSIVTRTIRKLVGPLPRGGPKISEVAR